MGEKKPGVVYKRKYRKAEDRIQPIVMQLLEKFCIVRNITGDPLEDIPALLTHPPNFTPGLRYTHKNSTTNCNLTQTDFCGQKRRSWRIIW
jgi:hypothetical protein